jgi:hypothetical protein
MIMDLNVRNQLYPIMYRYLFTCCSTFMRDLEQEGDAQ